MYTYCYYEFHFMKQVNSTHSAVNLTTWLPKSNSTTTNAIGRLFTSREAKGTATDKGNLQRNFQCRLLT